MLDAAAIERLLHPYLSAAPDEREHAFEPRLYQQLAMYLDLLLRWNARTNLTAIRDPEEIVRRHFGESLFLARHLPPCATLLDYGSGAGLPGVPVQLLYPNLQVTLAESQGKKAAFLREVVRALSLPTDVWSGRVEALPKGTTYDVVALRAVDKMDAALAKASLRASRYLAILGTRQLEESLPTNFLATQILPLPGSSTAILLLAQRA